MDKTVKVCKRKIKKWRRMPIIKIRTIDRKRQAFDSFWFRQRLMRIELRRTIREGYTSRVIVEYSDEFIQELAKSVHASLRRMHAR